MMFSIKFRPVIFIVLVLSSLTAAGTSAMFDSALLDKAGFEPAWQASISLDELERVSNIWELDGKLYVLTSSNYFYAINKPDGKRIFGKQLTDPGLPVFEPEIINGKLTIVVANRIIEMDPNLGVELASYDPGFTAINRAAKQSDYLFMISSDNIIYAVGYDDKLSRYRISADDGSPITSVVMGVDNGFFATRSGLIVCFDMSKKRVWQKKAKDSVTASLLYRNDSIYASSEDTNLYKFSRYDGSVQWLFRTGDVLFESVRIGEGTVYQYAKYKGLYCIDDETGETKWLLAEGRDVLTEKDGKAYVLTTDKNLVIMDNETNKPLKSVNFTGVDNFVVNSSDKNIYLADNLGRIVCVKIK